MITHFIQDPKKAASVASSQTINETGAYIGKFARVYAEESPSGAGFIRFDFMANDGKTASLRICVQDREKKEAFGANIVHAAMTVLRVAEMQAVERSIKFRDGSSKVVPLFMDLCNKPVGVFVQRENYIDDKGEDRYTMNLLTPFDPATQKTAKELINNSEAKDIEYKKAHVKDKTRKQSLTKTAPEVPAGHPAGASIDEEDMPF